MRKIRLLALIALNALAPQLQAQDDDAELGQTPPEPPVADSSIIDHSDEPVELPPITTGPAAVQPGPGPETKPAAPRAVEPVPDASAASEKSAPGWIESRRRPGASFGIGAFRPESLGKYNHYEYLYGKEKVSPYFYGGYYLFSYILDFGLMGRVGYYHAEGHPLAERPNLPLNQDLKDERKDNNQKLGLTLIPTQLTAEIALAPFHTRWVVLRAWTGVEYLYVQETVEPNLPSSSTASQASTYTSSGWNQGLVTGAMASFSLTGLDVRSDKSLRSLGIDRYYLSLFAENIKTTRDKFGNFDRKNYGIAFSFEGLR